MIHSDGPGCDLLVVAPHPDDAEIGCGGMIAALTTAGRRIWVVDLTRGELGTNATVDVRWDESLTASAVLGLAGRAQLELPDGFIVPDDREQAGQLVAVLRRLRPRWVVTAPDPVRHPDHVATPALVRRAIFLAQLAAFQPAAPAGRLHGDSDSWPEPTQRWAVEAQFAVCADDGRPAFYFDISAFWEQKQQALACHRSQFVREAGRLSTAINDPAFMERIDRRARQWGRRAGVTRAEAFGTDAAPVLTDLPDTRWI